jgi:hypothetical protein
MTSIAQIKKDKLFAMRGGDTAKVSTLNLLIAEIEKEMKLTGATDLTEDQVITVINRQIKKLDKEIEAYVEVGRSTEKQEAEKIVLFSYLPKQLTEEELKEMVAGIVATSKTIGEAMKSLSAQLKGKADMGKVSKMVKELQK